MAHAYNKNSPTHSTHPPLGTGPSYISSSSLLPAFSDVVQQNCSITGITTSIGIYDTTLLPLPSTLNMADNHLRCKGESVRPWRPPFAQKYAARSLGLGECPQTAARPNQDSSHAFSGAWLKLQCRASFHQMVAWPSGLRRWFKAPVTKVAWVRIPPLP